MPLFVGLGDRAHRWLVWSAWTMAVVFNLALVGGLFDGSPLAIAEVVVSVLGGVSFATLGALVVSKRRELLVGWLIVAIALFLSVGRFGYHLLARSNGAFDMATSQKLIVGHDVAFTFVGCGLLLLVLLVPDGRLPSGSWRPMLWLIGATTLFWLVMSIVQGTMVVDLKDWLSRTTAVSNAGYDLTTALETTLMIGFYVGAATAILLVWAVIDRYRSARGETRQQLKWIAAGCIGAIAWLLLWLPQPDGGWLVTVQRLMPGLAFVFLSVGFGTALFRYRLWAVDVVLRRSLVYGVLWGIIASIYVAVAAGLGLAAERRFPVSVAIALTAAATLVFQPARLRLEGWADRWVFGPKDTPTEAIQSLRAGVAGSGAEDIPGELVRICASAVRLDWVMMEVEGLGGAEWGTRGSGEEVSVSIQWGTERFGVLRCQPLSGTSLTGDETALLEALVGQAALAISHARLASRMVHAQEIERRRIERNIHDGAQQDLAALRARLAMARNQARDHPALRDELADIQSEVGRILGGLRELAQGIHPSVLRDGGLVVAIEDRCSRLPLEVNLEIDEGLSRVELPGEIEAVAYFATAEALTNTLKHSGSSSVDVSLRMSPPWLSVRVADDGVGFDGSALRAGSGLAGIADRVRAVGGRFHLPEESTTSFQVDLPLAREEQ